ncbi:diacylglycerol kinase family protein [Candidatus Falkowbacteria bacterium]|nr:diacylglycerol kinase family protein [Candidatus Falkowbacteria bacterium]
MFSLRKLIRSFGFAIKGIGLVFKSEQNFRIHILASIVVVAAGIFFKVAVWQWCLLISMILLIFLLEIVNTAFERMVDMLQPRVHLYAGEIKNMMSAMVLIAAIGSIIIAWLIFGPHLTTFFIMLSKVTGKF